MSVTIHPPGEVPQGQPGPQPSKHQTVETPTQSVVNAANEMRYVTDAQGRRIGWRKLNALEDFDLVEIAGDNNNNANWMFRASIAFSIREIDGEAVSRPLKKDHIRAMISRLGTDGMSAITEQILAEMPRDEADPENPAGPDAQQKADRNRGKG